MNKGIRSAQPDLERKKDRYLTLVVARRKQHPEIGIAAQLEAFFAGDVSADLLPIVFLARSNSHRGLAAI